MLQSPYDSSTLRVPAEGNFAVACIMSNLPALIGFLHDKFIFLLRCIWKPGVMVV